MTEAGITALLRNLVLEAPHDTFVERLDLVAIAADEIMVVMVIAGNLVSGCSIDPCDALHQSFFLQNGDEAENRGKIAALRLHLFVDIGQGEGNGASVEQAYDGDATTSGAKAVFMQPGGGVNALRCRFCAHISLYHTIAGLKVLLQGIIASLAPVR